MYDVAEHRRRCRGYPGPSECARTDAAILQQYEPARYHTVVIQPGRAAAAHGCGDEEAENAMQTAKTAFTHLGACAIVALAMVAASGCGTTTVIHQTVIVGTTPSASTAPATATIAVSPTATIPAAAASPPPGIWCKVSQGRTPLLSTCEIYPSPPQLYNPPQGEPVLAGTQVGPLIGSNGPGSVTEHMTNPWAADVDCGTNDNSNTGVVRILMVAHTGSADYYSWGDKPCGPPQAPSYGNEFFRKATATVTLSIRPVTTNLVYWSAEFIQL